MELHCQPFLKYLGRDKGDEYYESMFFYSICITAEASAPYIPQQNIGAQDMLWLTAWKTLVCFTNSQEKLRQTSIKYYEFMFSYSTCITPKASAPYILQQNIVAQDMMWLTSRKTLVCFTNSQERLRQTSIQ